MCLENVPAQLLKRLPQKMSQCLNGHSEHLQSISGWTPGTIRIPWGSCSGGRGSRNPGGKEVAPTRRSMRGQERCQSHPEQWGGAQRKVWNFWADVEFLNWSGISELIWNFWAALGVWWLVGVTRKGQMLILLMVSRAGFGAVLLSLHFGGMFVLCPHKTELFLGFLFLLCLSLHPLLVSLQLCSSEPWLLHISV